MCWRLCAEIGDLRRCVAAHNLELKISPVPALSPPQNVENLDESVAKKTVRQFLALVLSKFSDDKLHKIFADTQVHKGDSKVTSPLLPTHLCADVVYNDDNCVVSRAESDCCEHARVPTHEKLCRRRMRVRVARAAGVASCAVPCDCIRLYIRDCRHLYCREVKQALIHIKSCEVPAACTVSRHTID